MPELNQRTIAALPGPEPGKTDRIHWDDALPGLGLRCWSSGKRTWIVRYRLGTRQRVVTLGTLVELTAGKARQKAKDILAARRLGDDERQKIEARKAEAAKPKGMILADLIRAYGEHAMGGLKPRSAAETRRYLENVWQPLHAVPLASTSRAVVSAELLQMARQRGPVTANRARAALSASFAWAITAGMVDQNPVIGTVKNDERTRDRVLSADELRLIWQATNEPGDYARIVRLLILTGQRREEVAGLTWGEIDPDRAEWTLPAERAKNGRAHVVPLSDQALAIVQAVPVRPRRALVFGQGDGPFSGWSQSKARLDRRVALLRAKAASIEQPGAEATAAHELPNWVVHDIRRSVVTHMAELGIEPHVIEAIVNHVSGHKAGVAGIYNRATYAVGKRAALQAWADHVMRLVAGEPVKVVPLRRSNT
jgi:integrase